MASARNSNKGYKGYIVTAGSALDPARRFLNAFHRIEQLLRQQSGTSEHVRFYELVDGSRLLTREQKKRLKELADLRNVISHHPYSDDDEPYANPRAETVRWIETQADYIEKPPRVVSALKLQPPVVLMGEDSLPRFLAMVGFPANFSQAPYRRANGELGLITTNAVARWLAMQYQGDGYIAEDVTIEQVVGVGAELKDRVLLKRKSYKVVDALAAFAGDRTVEPPAAIVITDSGLGHETPLGIVTPSDIPGMAKILTA